MLPRDSRRTSKGCLKKFPPGKCCAHLTRATIASRQRPRRTLASKEAMVHCCLLSGPFYCSWCGLGHPGSWWSGIHWPCSPSLWTLSLSFQMFKGPEKDIEFIYTAPSSAVCGVSLDVGGKKEYLIAGALEGNPGCRKPPSTGNFCQNSSMASHSPSSSLRCKCLTLPSRVSLAKLQRSHAHSYQRRGQSLVSQL